MLRSWLDGSYELVASEMLLAELERALSYPRLQGRILPGEAAELVGLIRRQAEMLEDFQAPPRIRSSDPGDDYLIALAEFGRAALVSGDTHLLSLQGLVPVYSPAEFLELLAGPPEAR